MKLTREEVERRLTAFWGEQAFVVPYHISGNRYHWAARNDSHWMPLASSWENGRQVFEPVGNDTWPDPEPGHDPWLAAVREAHRRAFNYFTKEGNRAALKRLPRALAIAERERWIRLGDERDTFAIASQSKGGVVYLTNGHCTCPDYQSNGAHAGWCKHRIARGLAKRAMEILKNGNGAESDADSSAPTAGPEGTNKQEQDTTPIFSGQADRIDLILAYHADEMNSLAHMNANGEVVRVLADGQEVRPPVQTTPELYRWLQAQGYVPADFKWLHWERGLRHRRQTYIRDNASVSAATA